MGLFVPKLGPNFFGVCWDVSELLRGISELVSYGLDKSHKKGLKTNFAVVLVLADTRYELKYAKSGGSFGPYSSIFFSKNLTVLVI